MPVLLIIVGLVILIAVVLVAAGRGGELSDERSDYAPLDLGPVSATDVALLRPPANAWGYNMQATDEALEQMAESIRQRDVRIVALEQLVTDLSRDPAPPSVSNPYIGSRRREALPEATHPAQAALPAEATQPAQAAEPEPEEGTWWPAAAPSWPETTAPAQAPRPDASQGPPERSHG